MKFQSKQAYYDEVVLRYMEGTLPSINEKGYCSYRSPTGNSCVAGMLLPDKNYYPYMEGKTADSVPLEKFELAPDGTTMNDIKRLQQVHDRNSPTVDLDFIDNCTCSADFAQGAITDMNNLPYFKDVSQIKGLRYFP